MTSLETVLSFRSRATSAFTAMPAIYAVRPLVILSVGRTTEGSGAESNDPEDASLAMALQGVLPSSKTDTAMTNEALCKVLCHNLTVLIHEMYELGIDPVFWEFRF
jgi:hypothetical protein